MSIKDYHKPAVLLSDTERMARETGGECCVKR